MFSFCWGSFSRFLRSFHRRPATAPVGLGTAVMWPMPLPFPGACRASIAGSEKIGGDFQRGINFAIALLNWLHLNRPDTCPFEIALGRSLNKIQWRVVRQIQSTMAAWDEMESITMANMGRAATKIADMSLFWADYIVFRKVCFKNLMSLFQISVAAVDSIVRNRSFLLACRWSLQGIRWVAFQLLCHQLLNPSSPTDLISNLSRVSIHLLFLMKGADSYFKIPCLLHNGPKSLFRDLLLFTEEAADLLKAS